MRIIKVVVVAVSMAVLASCATGPKFNSIRRGMSPEQVQSIVGSPDEALNFEGNDVYRWVNRLVSDWGYDKADFYVVIDSRTNTVGKYGQENYRQAVRHQAAAPIYQAPAAPTKFSCETTSTGLANYTDCTGR